MGKKAKKEVCIFGANFMLQQVHRLKNEIEGVISGKNVEHVHQMRVISRRLRNSLECFNECLPEKQVKKWQEEIRRITHTLGAARDLDIQIEMLTHFCEDNLDAKFKPGYRRLLLRLKQRRTKTQKKINKTIRRMEEREILQTMQDYFEKQAVQSEGIYLYTPALYKKAFGTIHAALEKFLSFKPYLEDPLEMDKLHAMRIAGKNLRYTLEIFAPIYKQALNPHIQAMKNIQDRLGEIHDNDVWVNWLPKFLQEEQARIEDYFGNTGPLKRLLPGLNHLTEDRKAALETSCRDFLSTWNSLQKESAWENLMKIIEAPFNINAAMDFMVHDNEQEIEQKENSTAIPKNLISKTD